MANEIPMPVVLGIMFAAVMGIIILFILQAKVSRKIFERGIRKARELVKEIEEGPITRRDIIRGRYVIKLARKYGPAKAILLQIAIFTPFIFRVAFFVLITFTSFTLIESLIIGILLIIMVTAPMMLFMYYWLKEAVKKNSEEEKGNQSVF
ncbi:MAG: hypothetical protein ACFE7E_07300 [Candidatus Hodarchaeota archaeon]